jgi:ankyrin repeat protein
MFAAASNRAAVIAVLASNGADLQATSKVTDLAALSRDPAALREFTQGNPQLPGEPPTGSRNGPAPVAPGRGGRGAQTAGVDRNFQLNELVAAQGGLTPLLLAAREGHVESVQALLTAGADVNQASAGDGTNPLLIATINGHFDLARLLIETGANPQAASENNVTPLYAALNCEWAPKALYPQPRAQVNQKTTYIELMKALLDKGADPNVRLNKKVWYSGYSFDLSGVDETGATPFWRAAYASDVDAMKMLVAYGADPNIRTKRIAGRPRAGDVDRDVKDVSGLLPVPVGGPAVTPLQAAAGVGYGEGFAANSHRFAPVGMLAAVKYLVEELHADVNAFDHEGNTALHHAAARGDVEMIQYLVSKGADVKAVTREGKTTADMANGPVQRIQPWPEALARTRKRHPLGASREWLYDRSGPRYTSRNGPSVSRLFSSTYSSAPETSDQVSRTHIPSLRPASWGAGRTALSLPSLLSLSERLGGARGFGGFRNRVRSRFIAALKYSGCLATATPLTLATLGPFELPAAAMIRSSHRTCRSIKETTASSAPNPSRLTWPASGASQFSLGSGAAYVWVTVRRR